VWAFWVAIACFLFASRGFAASDSWSTNLSGSWSVTGNWLSGTGYATGADATADFSVISGSTVTDDLTSNTIGYLSFGSNGATLSPADSTSTLTFQTTVANTTPSITVSGGTSTIGVILAGNQGLAKLGAGTSVLTGSNTLSGSVALNGGILSLSGSGGALPSVTGYTIQSGATLKLDNTTAGNSPDRISNSGTLIMKGGTFIFSNDAAASTGYSETVGPLQISLGGNTITTSTAATTGSSSVTFSSISRSPGTVLNFATAAVLSTSRNGIFFSTPPTLDSGNLIGGWALVGGTDFATYGANGVAATTYTADTEPNWVAGDNVSMTASTTASSSHTINALKLPNRNTALTLSSSLGTFLLTIQNGGILETQGGASAQSVNITGGSLTAGTAGIGGEMVINSALGSSANVYRLGITSSIVDNQGGPVSLTIGTVNNTIGRVALMSTSNTYSGDTTVVSGALNIGNGNGQVIPFGAGKGNVILYGTLEMAGNNQQINGLNGTGLVTNTKWDNAIGASAVTLTVGNNNANGAFSGTIVGTGGNRTIALTKVGTGSQILSGNGYTLQGTVTVSGGTMQIGDGTNSTASIGANAIADNATLAYNFNGPVTISNAISGGGAVVQMGSSTLTTNAAETFSGGLYVNGTVIAGGTLASALGAGKVVMANNTTIDVNGNSRTTGLLSTTGNGAGVGITSSTVGTPVLTISGTSSQTFGGIIGNGSATTLGINKLGTGSQALTGANTYTGPTNVLAGTLAVAANGSLSNTALTVNSGGLLSLQPGSGTINLGNTATVGAGATLTLAAGTGANAGGGFSMVDGAIGTVNLVQEGTFSGAALTLGGTGSAANQPQLGFELGAGNTSDRLVITAGTVSVGATGAGIALTPLTGLTSLATGNYTLITAPAGLGTSFSLLTPTLAVGTHTYNVDLLSSSSTAEVINLSVGSPLNAYWGGAHNASWSSNASGATNWLDGPSGNDTQQLPGPASNVFLTANSAANVATTLDGNLTINSLSFTGSGTTAGSGSVSIAGGSGGTLTINAANGFSDANSTNYPIGTGLVVQPGSAAHLIGSDVNLNLGASQKWLMNSSNPLTVAATIGDNGNGYSLTVSGTGTLILTGSSTYTGATTVNTGTLQLGSGGTSGSVAGPIIDNNLLVLNRADDYSLGNVISGSGNLSQTGSDNVTLSATNTFTGSTVISAGTLTTGSNLALQNSTLNYNNQGGVLSFGGGTSASLGALTGSQSLVLQNTSSAAVALTVGSNNSNATYSGNLSDLGVGGSLTKTGNGTFTLTGSNSYTGGITINAGTVVLVPGCSINGGAITLTSLAGCALDVNGGVVNAGGTSSVLGSDTLLVTSGSTAFAVLNLFTDNKNNGGILSITGGTVTAASINSGRTSLSNTTQPAAGSNTTGIYVTSGVVNVGGINVGTASANTNSSASFRMDGGAVNVSGTVSIGLNNGGRWSVFDVNGGSLVVSDTVSGVLLGGPLAGNAEFLVRAGVANVPIITFGQGAVADTVATNVTGGQLYVGAGGMVLGSASATPALDLAGGTLGASAPWSTSIPVVLTGNATSGGTVLTADAAGNANAITFSGNISGTGALTKIGTGVLTFTGNNTYTGATVVNAGTLAVVGATTGVATNAANDLLIASTTSSVAVVTMSNGSTLNASRVVVGGNQANSAGGVATLTQNDGTINAGRWMTVGSTGTGTFNQLGGVANVNMSGGTTQAHFEVGVFGAATGVVNQSPGTALNLDYNANIQMGGFPGQNDAAGVDSGNGTFNQNGSTVTFYSDAGFTIGGSGQLALGEGLSRTGTYTYNLNGGTLTVPEITSHSGTSIFNLNGGVIVATGGTAGLMHNLTAAYVTANGGTIESNGQTQTISQSLLHDATGPALDGGLVFTGGTLTLTGTNTYTGATYVNGGTVIVTSAAGLEDGVNLYVGAGAETIIPAPVIGASQVQLPAPAPAAVPEPATFALLSLGLAGAVICIRARSPRSLWRV
jgi:autotransporter-associated beta strand protein